MGGNARDLRMPNLLDQMITIGQMNPVFGLGAIIGLVLILSASLGRSS